MADESKIFFLFLMIITQRFMPFVKFFFCFAIDLTYRKFLHQKYKEKKTQHPFFLVFPRDMCTKMVYFLGNLHQGVFETLPREFI